jgi:tetratricopeptide (TPR) repeat protein
MINFASARSRPRYLTMVGVLVMGFGAASVFPVPHPALAAEKWRELVEAAGYAYEARRAVQAQQLLEEAVGHTEPDTEERAAVLNNLAIVLEANGLEDAAEILYGQVIDTWAKVLGPAHPNVSRTLANLGDLHHRRGEMEKALEAYEVAIATAEQATGEDTTKLKRALYRNYARLLNDLGRDEDAEAARLKAFPPGN